MFIDDQPALDRQSGALRQRGIGTDADRQNDQIGRHHRAIRQRHFRHPFFAEQRLHTGAVMSRQPRLRRDRLRQQCGAFTVQLLGQNGRTAFGHRYRHPGLQ